MNAFGYADRFSVRAGETIRFHVSSTVPRYRVDLVRYDRAFTEPDLARDVVIDASFAGDYDGVEQVTQIGSWGVVRDLPFPAGGEFTLAAWIAPGVVGEIRQGVLAQWDPASGGGFGIGIDREGRLAGRTGDGAGAVGRVVIDEPLHPNWWYLVVLRRRADGDLVLTSTQRNRAWLPAVTRSAGISGSPAPAPASAPLLMAAAFTERVGIRDIPRHHFNGKIDRPALWHRALSDGEVETLAADGAGWSITDGLIGAWDFSRDIGTDWLTDASGSGRHGKVVNFPARGMTGANWDGAATSFREQPAHYGAIAFHDDDLEDCGWTESFRWTVPGGLRSGIYAARVQAGDTTDYIPIYLRPAANEAAADVLFLAPTNTYLAYGNERLYRGMEAEPEFVAKSSTHTVVLSGIDNFLEEHPELGASTYDLHRDGTGTCTSTRLRPVMTMRPQFLNWLTGDVRHFSGDLLLVEWMERQGFHYDVATDEDLHMEGSALLDRYKVVLTGDHPEYWTGPMLDALEGWLARGGKLLYLGGNGFYWVTGIRNHAPYSVEIRRGINGTRAWSSQPGELHLAFSGEMGGLWRYRGRIPNKLTGIGFASEGWGGAPGYERLPDSDDPRAAFIFEGVDRHALIGEHGLVMGGAAGDEIDRYDLALGTPPETLRLATSEGRHTDYYQLVIEDCTFMFPGHGGTEDPKVRADITLLESPDGGAVFSTGSINWIGSLMTDGGDNDVSRITGNVVREFLAR